MMSLQRCLVLCVGTRAGLSLGQGPVEVFVYRVFEEENKWSLSALRSDVPLFVRLFVCVL